MITGFNTDVDYEGKVFHVQTEDKGRSNPVVESLVYAGGEIVASRRASYGELAKSDQYSEPEVLRRMEAQHQALIREIRNGRFDPDGPRPFGEQIISNRSFDEVVADFLAQHATVERIRLEMIPKGEIEEGSRVRLRMRVTAAASDRPVVGAKVAVKMISTLDRPRELTSGATDGDGWLDAAVDIPVLPGGNAALLFQAEAGDSTAESQHLVRKRPFPLPDGTPGAAKP
jgi:hypothetical protein